mgnify:CR=1 FL=1
MKRDLTTIQKILRALFGWVSASWAIPAISLIVTVDQWVASTGAADPYKFELAGSPFSPMAAARGIAIVLSVSYVLRQVRTLWKGQGKSNSSLRLVLTGAVIAMLLIEMSVITPWIISTMYESPMAKMMLGFTPFDLPIGKFVYVVWSMFVATISLLAVGASSLATFAGDTANSSTAIQTNEQTETSRVHEQGTKTTERRAVPTERTNGHLTDEMVLRLYTEQPGCSLADGAQWLIAQYALANEQDKLRQVLRRRATALVGHGLRADGNGKFFIEHNIGAATELPQAHYDGDITDEQQPLTSESWADMRARLLRDKGAMVE